MKKFQSLAFVLSLVTTSIGYADIEGLSGSSETSLSRKRPSTFKVEASVGAYNRQIADTSNLPLNTNGAFMNTSFFIGSKFIANLLLGLEGDPDYHRNNFFGGIDVEYSLLRFWKLNLTGLFGVSVGQNIVYEGLSHGGAPQTQAYPVFGGRLRFKPFGEFVGFLGTLKLDRNFQLNSLDLGVTVPL